MLVAARSLFGVAAQAIGRLVDVAGPLGATRPVRPGSLAKMLRMRRTDLTSSPDLLPRGALKQDVKFVELPAYAAADLFAELEHPFVRD